MLLKAINSIHCSEGMVYSDGDIFLVADVSEAERIIKLGAAIPVRKKINLSFSSESTSDDIASDLMNERRKSDLDKIIIDAGCDQVVPMSEASVSENNGSQCEIGDGFLSSLNERVQAESGSVVTHENHAVFTPQRGAPVSQNTVNQFVKNQIGKESGLVTDHKK